MKDERINRKGCASIAESSCANNTESIGTSGLIVLAANLLAAGKGDDVGLSGFIKRNH